MADPIRIDIAIALRDSISGTLRNVSREMEKIHSAAVEGGGSAKRGYQELAQGAEQAGQAIQRTNRSILGFTAAMRALSGIFTGAAIAGALVAFARGMTNLASQSIQLRHFSTQTGIAGERIVQLRQALQRSAISEKEADTWLARITEKISQFRSQGAASEIASQFRDLGAKTAEGAKLAEEAQERLRNALREGGLEGGVRESQKIVNELIEQSEEFYKRDDAASKIRAENLRQVALYIQQIIFEAPVAARELEKNLGKGINLPLPDPKKMQEFHDRWVDLGRVLERIFTELGIAVAPAILSLAQSFDRYLQGPGGKKLAEDLSTIGKAIEGFFSDLPPAAKSTMEALGGFMGGLKDEGVTEAEVRRREKLPGDQRGAANWGEILGILISRMPDYARKAAAEAEADKTRTAAEEYELRRPWILKERGEQALAREAPNRPEYDAETARRLQQRDMLEAYRRERELEEQGIKFSTPPPLQRGWWPFSRTSTADDEDDWEPGAGGGGGRFPNALGGRVRRVGRSLSELRESLSLQELLNIQVDTNRIIVEIRDILRRMEEGDGDGGGGGGGDVGATPPVPGGDTTPGKTGPTATPPATGGTPAASPTATPGTSGTSPGTATTPGATEPPPPPPPIRPDLGAGAGAATPAPPTPAPPTRPAGLGDAGATPPAPPTRPAGLGDAGATPAGATPAGATPTVRSREEAPERERRALRDVAADANAAAVSVRARMDPLTRAGLERVGGEGRITSFDAPEVTEQVKAYYKERGEKPPMGALFDEKSPFGRRVMYRGGMAPGQTQETIEHELGHSGADAFWDRYLNNKLSGKVEEKLNTIRGGSRGKLSFFAEDFEEARQRFRDISMRATGGGKQEREDYYFTRLYTDKGMTKGEFGTSEQMRVRAFRERKLQDLNKLMEEDLGSSRKSVDKWLSGGPRASSNPMKADVNIDIPSATRAHEGRGDNLFLPVPQHGVPHDARAGGDAAPWNYQSLAV